MLQISQIRQRPREGVSRCAVKASLGKNDQSAHSGEDDKEHEEHAVHDHGDILPVLLQLERDGWVDETAWIRGKVKIANRGIIYRTQLTAS